MYPGLPSHPQHQVAKKQMKMFSGMIAAEIKGGIQGGKILVEVRYQGRVQGGQILVEVQYKGRGSRRRDSCRGTKGRIQERFQ
jgi:hypothetical protein